MQPKIKYITNRDLLAEIKVCKASYCHFTAPEYAFYDAIVTGTDLITPELVADTIKAKANKMSTKTAVVDPASIPPDSIVFRVMTDSHLPIIGDKTKRRETAMGEMIKANFTPFRHYILRGDQLIEVGRSHWKGDFETGGFSVAHGKINNRLASMFMLLVEQYARRGNWRNYTYNDEMRSHALVQLSQVGLQFDESRSDNPFAFFTQIIKNCLSFDTIILTREYGAVPIGQIAEQDVTLLDGNRQWVKCHIHDHGVQETVNVNFFGNFEKVSIRSTLEHDWILDTHERLPTRCFVENNGNDTRGLMIEDLRPAKTVINEDEYRRGVVHGLIYGDGSAAPNCKDFYFMRICQPKAELAQWFSEYPVSFSAKHEGDPTFYLAQIKTNLKQLPSAPGTDLDYLKGFLRGWLATDGCVSKTGDVTICGDLAEYAWLRQWAPLIGWHIGDSPTPLAEQTNYGYRNKLSHNIHVKKRSVCDGDFLRTQHKDRRIANSLSANNGWKVYPASQNRQDYARRMERVFCPVVESTGSFALASGIHSGNCFRRILNLEKRSQDIRDDLLIMYGAMPSYTRQVENEIDQRDDYSTEAPKAAKRGRKPKSTT